MIEFEQAFFLALGSILGVGVGFGACAACVAGVSFIHEQWAELRSLKKVVERERKARIEAESDVELSRNMAAYDASRAEESFAESLEATHKAQGLERRIAELEAELEESRGRL